MPKQKVGDEDPGGRVEAFNLSLSGKTVFFEVVENEGIFGSQTPSNIDIANADGHKRKAAWASSKTSFSTGAGVTPEVGQIKTEVPQVGFVLGLDWIAG